MTKHWYCVRSKPRAEATAEEHLQQQGFVTYWPRISKKKSLFPRYLFCEIDLDKQPWNCIRSTIGVQHWVGGAIPTVCPDKAIAEIRARENADGYIELEPPPLRTGDKIKIVDGKYEGYRGLFAGTDRDRTSVLLSILGHEVWPVTVATKLVVAA